jgi:hypothetical protein
MLSAIAEATVWRYVKQIHLESGLYKKTKVIGHRSGGRGVIRERLLPGLEIDADNTMPPFQARIWVLFEGEHKAIGHLFRCGNKQVDWLVTAAHNVANFADTKAFLQDSKGNETEFDFNGFEFVDGVDVAVKPYTMKTNSSGFSLTKANVAERISQRSEMVKIVGTNGNSIGPLRHDDNIFGQVVVDASTAKGFSGAPYYTNKTVFGVHYGAFADKNVGYDITYVLAIFRTAETDYWYQKYMSLDDSELREARASRRIEGDNVVIRFDGSYKRISQKEYDYWEQLNELESYEEAGLSDEPRRQKVHQLETELSQLRKVKKSRKEYEEECVNTSTFVDVEQPQENSNSPAPAAALENTAAAAIVSNQEQLTLAPTPPFVSAVTLLRQDSSQKEQTEGSPAIAGPGQTPVPRKLASETISALQLTLEPNFMQLLKKDISDSKVKGSNPPGGKMKFLHDACLRDAGLGLADFQKATAQMAIITSPERLKRLSSERQEQNVERYALFQQIWAKAQADWKTRTQTN